MPKIYLKREDLNHTGAHKINNALGQALLCKRMGKTRIIAETGAGQHGVATVRLVLRGADGCWWWRGDQSDVDRVEQWQRRVAHPCTPHLSPNRPLCAPAWVSSASCTWAPRTWSARCVEGLCWSRIQQQQQQQRKQYS